MVTFFYQTLLITTKINTFNFLLIHVVDSQMQGYASY